ncbi:MAG: isoprenylcysteine carboxylmethyltransferase family protein [Planctomycetota bacterium]
MTQTTAATSVALSDVSSSALKRYAAFGYGLTCYAVGVSGLVAMILATLGILPFTGGPVQLASTPTKIAFNLGLVALFGIQHAIMARPAFKERWTRIIHPAIERSTFTGLAGAIMGTLIWLWQPMPAMVWSVDSEGIALALRGLCAFGWAYLLAATFAVDHFELFGVKQVWRNLRDLPTPPPNFKERLMYRFDRHPIMTGVAVGLWSTPSMTVGHLALALGFSAYIVLGVALEERDLRRHHGARYADYARRVKTIVPRLSRDA